MFPFSSVSLRASGSPCLVTLPVGEGLGVTDSSQRSLLNRRKLANRAIVVDASGQILASQDRCDHLNKIQLPEFSQIACQDRGYIARPYRGTPCIIGYAKSHGFETFPTG